MPTSFKEPEIVTNIKEKKIIMKALNLYNLKFDPEIYKHYIFIPKDFKGFSRN